MKPPPDKQLILDSIIAIAKGAGRTPSRSEFLSLAGISEHYVLLYFPTWNEAVKAAGLRPNTLNVRLEDRELLEDWAFAVRKNRKIPARPAYFHLGQYGARTFERRFGPWSKLPEVFRNFAHGKPEWADVVALLPDPAPEPSPKRVPNPQPNSAASTASNHPAPSNDRAPSRQSPSTPLLSKVRYPPLDNRPTYGSPLDFRGLRHEPVNEQGVVLLFGLVAKELGYIVEAVQSGFPDCEAKRQIGPQRRQRVHIEFEFESRNFRDHGHPFTGCDVNRLLAPQLARLPSPNRNPRTLHSDSIPPHLRRLIPLLGVRRLGAAFLRGSLLPLPPRLHRARFFFGACLRDQPFFGVRELAPAFPSARAVGARHVVPFSANGLPP